MRSHRRSRGRRLHRPAGRARRPRRAARRAVRGRRVRLRRQGRHRLRYNVAARSAGSSECDRDTEATLHRRQGTAAAARALGPTGDYRSRRVHRVDRPSQAPPLAAPRCDVVITHPDKLLFPADGITKGDVAAYYKMIAPVMLPHIVRRPVTMERYPSGIGKKGFWQKDVSKGFPDWLERVEAPKKDGVV